MSKLLALNHKALPVAVCLFFLLSAVALALNTKIDSITPQHVEKSTEQPIRIIENDDSPLRIVEAKVTEVPGSQFTKLTGKVTDLTAVSSVPEVEIVNTSGRTVIGFVLVIRDPKSRSTRGVVQRKIMLAPGDTFVVKRKHFVSSDNLTVAGENGQIHQTRIEPEINSEKYWIEFAGRSDLFVTIGLVNFEDGSSWRVKEGGEIR